MPAFGVQQLGNALGWGLVDDAPNSSSGKSATPGNTRAPAASSACRVAPRGRPATRTTSRAGSCSSRCRSRESRSATARSREDLVRGQRLPAAKPRWNPVLRRRQLRDAPRSARTLGTPGTGRSTRSRTAATTPALTKDYGQAAAVPAGRELREPGRRIPAVLLDGSQVRTRPMRQPWPCRSQSSRFRAARRRSLRSAAARPRAVSSSSPANAAVVQRDPRPRGRRRQPRRGPRPRPPPAAPSTAGWPRRPREDLGRALRGVGRQRQRLRLGGDGSEQTASAAADRGRSSGLTDETCRHCRDELGRSSGTRAARSGGSKPSSRSELGQRAGPPRGLSVSSS